ncbi:SepM family pheromone-processing serine protease [Bacillus sp. M6-12]|uniref:SepM family pheromone-processing serine protease n=1 Tax=Bacillus sp. M6-12 TaxID=2054166 RepID=UPI002155A854|nr:SepM family pheromone-processing serine protease [Bacillus sp. M6-12]
MKKRNPFARSFLLALLLIAGSSFIYLPYYVSKPGMAKELEPIIEVEGGDDAKGSFMLTTVRMGKANIYSYAAAKFNKYHEIYPEKYIRAEDETDEEYNIRQLHLMEGSKINAIKTAYHEAGKKYEIKYRGVFVSGIMENMPAEGILKAGDRITAADGIAFKSSEEFTSHVSKKKAGETVTLTIKRDGKKKTVKLKVQPFKQDASRVGVGISLVEDKSISTDPKVEVKTDQIGGPSAGLMFSLEIYNQLTKGDLTKGYNIAGTGTMEEGEKVGPIGGIQQKIVAADQAGAEIFLAPNEGGESGSNYREALIAAKDINTSMKIIPIDTFSEAVDYLEGLKAKK